MICWLLFPRLGRATIYMAGMTAMFFCLVAIGGLGFSSGKQSELAIGILLVISTLANMTTIGPACYPIVAETPSGRLRYKTIVIGRFVYNLTGIFSNSLTPRMIAATGKSFLSSDSVLVVEKKSELTRHVQLGTGVRRRVCSTPEQIFSATSGAGFDCPRRKVVPSARSTSCLKPMFLRGSSSTQMLSVSFILPTQI